MNESYWDKLKGEIHEKCVVYEYIDQSDMSLAEFIIGILQMGKSPDEVSRELSSLIGDDYEPQITQWIFSRLEELKNPSTTTSEYNNGNNFNKDNSNNDTNMTEENDIENKTTATTRQILPERRNRIFTQALDGLRQSDSKTSSLSSSYSRHGYSRSRSRSPEIYKERTSYRDRKENDIHSRLGGSKLSSSSSPSYSRHRYSSRSRSRSRSPERNKERVSFRDRKENDIHSRLGKKETSTSSSVFDRLGIQKPESIDEKPPRKRCKYWPTCEKGDDCTYIHPDTLCPDFPNCPKPTNECIFIHPETRSKKPVPAHHNLTQKAIPCRFFPYCTNDQCPYFHPPLPAYPPMATTASIKRIPVPCKNGDQCERPDCHFLHPKDTNPADVICKFDGACTRPGCFYKHTIQSTTYPTGTRINKTLIVNPSPFEPPKHTNERVFAIADDTQVEKMVVGESADIIKM